MSTSDDVSFAPAPPTTASMFGNRQQLSSMSQLSPYLNINPSYLDGKSGGPEFIYNQDMKRGGMEKSFSAIGTSLFIGGSLGGTYGVYEGIRQTALHQLQGKVRRTQILNYTLKTGSNYASSLATIAVLYSSIHWLSTWLVEPVEDGPANKSRQSSSNLTEHCRTIASGSITGMLYKLPAGAYKSGMGAAFGLLTSSIYTFGIKSSSLVRDFV